MKLRPGSAIPVAILALSGTFAGVATVASAATTKPAGGRIWVWVNFNIASPNTQKVLLTGAIGDFGTATSEDKNGKVDPNGNYVKVALRQGGFVLNATVLNQKSSAATGNQNLATCSFSSVVSAPVTLSGGTGLYAGISGTLQATEAFALLGSRYPSGSKKGQCETSSSSRPVAAYGSVSASGTVTFR